MKGLKELRISKGLTQEQLAALVGVGRSTVTCWELEIKMPSAGKLQKLAKALECSIDELFGENKRKETA